jgi:hypothetical protein
MEPTNDAAADAQPLERYDTEQEDVFAWRFGQICSLGIDLLDAQLLAETGADLGLLRRLVGQGCPPALAARIVL